MKRALPAHAGFDLRKGGPDMDQAHFVEEVQKKAELSTPEAAEYAIAATLRTLAERLAGGGPRHLASQLPDGIARYVGEKGKGERFGVEEFYERVARREQGNVPTARRHALGVMKVLTLAIDEQELRNLSDQLPDEYQELFTWSGSVDVDAPGAEADAEARVPLDEAPEVKARRRAESQGSSVVH